MLHFQMLGGQLLNIMLFINILAIVALIFFFFLIYFKGILPVYGFIFADEVKSVGLFSTNFLFERSVEI
jgi:hypothetical protein